MKKPIIIADAMAKYIEYVKNQRDIRFFAEDRQKYKFMQEKWAAALEAKPRLQKDFEEAASAALGAVLDEVQKRAKVRTISAGDIVSALYVIEKLLNISKKSMDGVSVTVDLNAQKFPSAYKYTPESTIFTAEYKRGQWRITDICRDTTKAPSNKAVVVHTDASRAAILERFSRMDSLPNGEI